jgi:CheY-like chemotaxis protein
VIIAVTHAAPASRAMEPHARDAADVPEKVPERWRNGAVGPMARRDMTILVVDDEEVIRLVLKTALAMAGHEVHEARSGTEGLEKARTLIPDLIITDLTMPGMSGYELVEELKRAPELSDVPVMVLTAKRSVEIDAENAPIAAYLTKPFTLNDLYAKVKGLLFRPPGDESQ